MSHPLRVVTHLGDVVEDLLQGPIDLDAFFDAHGSASCAPNTFSAATVPAHEVLRAGLTLYSPKCVEGAFCELLRLSRVLGTSRLLRSLTFAAVAFVVESHLAPIRQEQRHLPHRAYRSRQ